MTGRLLVVLLFLVSLASFTAAAAGPNGGLSLQPITIQPARAPINDRGPARAHPPGSPPPRNAQTIPFWVSSFTYAGQEYIYGMVGANPADGASTTVVRAKIVPIRLVFRSDGQVLFDDTMVDDVLGSPAFTPVDLGLGPLQWHELIQHVSLATEPNYRLILEPDVLPVQTISVPADEGFTIWDDLSQRRLGVVSLAWSERKAKELIGALQISPNDLVIFLEDNTLASLTTAADCLSPSGCNSFAGWHSLTLTGGRGPNNPPPQVNTLIWAAWRDYGAQLPPGLDYRSLLVSHEIAEWAADPFLINMVPEWLGPFTGPAHACQNVMEVADPVEGLPIGVPLPDGRTTVMTNAAMLSWFARESPSLALFGLYDLTGTITSPSTPCQ